jgi:hypothetical protein
VRTQSDLATLQALHRLRTPGPDPLPDGTWQDLDLDQVFASLDRCASVLGGLTLLGWLRAPVERAADLPALAARVATGDALAAAATTWAGLAEHLGRLPWLPLLLGEVLWGTARLPTLGRAPAVLAAAAALAPLGFALSTQAGVLAVLAAFAVNLGYHLWASRRVGQALGSLEFVGALLAAARQVAQARLPGLEAVTSRLGELTRRLRPLARAVGEVTVPAVLDDFPAEHLRIYGLSRERRLTRSARLVEASRAELLEVLETLGTLEAAEAVATFRRQRPSCAPVFEGEVLEVVGARHPALPGAVANDLRLEGGLVITGSNMSGKSTFLRTLALEAVFAQALGFACATSYRGPLVRVGTSLRSRDDLAEGQSTYGYEAQRVRALLAQAEGPPRALVLIDEPFRGTNSPERIAAGVAVLRHLRRQGALVVAATHDLEVARRLEGAYAHGYFQDQVTADGLRFDYLLRPGLSGPRNALRLLAVLGYPEQVLEEAEALLAEA